MRRRHVLGPVAVVAAGLAALHLAMALLSWFMDAADTTIGGVVVPRIFAGHLLGALVAGSVWQAARLLRGQRELLPHTEKDANLAVGIAWLVGLALVALGYGFTGTSGAIDAIFEAASTVTATGATLLDVPNLPASILWWRAILQAVAGFAFVTLAVALLSHLTHGNELTKAKAPGHGTRLLGHRLEQTARAFAPTYGFLLGATSLLLTVVLWLRGHLAPLAAIREGVLGGLGVVATAGVQGRTSITSLGDPVVDAVLILGMLGAATSAILHVRLHHKDVRAVTADPEWRLLVTAWAATTLVTALVLWRTGHGTPTALRQAPLAMAAFVSTTGIDGLATATWPENLQLMSIIIMLVGGSAGSAAGGIKLARIIVLGRVMQRELRKLNHPRAVIPLRIQGRSLSDERVWLVIALVFAAITTWMVGTLLVVAFDPAIDLLQGAGAAAAAISNTGSAWSHSGVGFDHNGLTPLSRLVMAALMWMGRVELFTAFLVASPRSWRA